MGLFNWIRGFFDESNTLKLSDAYYVFETDFFYKKLAVETCIDLIANTIVLCEFQTFENGKERRGKTHHLLNVAPNQNQNASEFVHSLINHLFMNNECLVIMQDEQLYVADSFTRQEYAMKENIYKDVTLGDFTFNKSFLESEVLYFRLNDRNVMNVIDGLYDSFGKLITASMNIYKRSNAKRVILKGDFLRPQTDEEQKLINDMFESQFKSWFEADNAGAVFQLQKGYELEDVSGSGKSGAAATNSRDVRATIDDIFDFVSMGFHIPRGLLKGDLADVEKQTDNFLMFCINPLAKLIAAEINRKMYTRDEYIDRTYVKVDTTMIRILDIVDLATAADKFFAIGANTINDNLRMLGRETLDEDWADQRFVTKNYQTIEAVEDSKGGDGK